MAIDPEQNINKRIPEIPHDGNRKWASVLVVPIVDNGEVIGYLPVKATDNGDGTATLATAGGGGGGGVDPVGLKNIAAIAINPSTEDTLLLAKGNLDDVKTKLDTLNAKDFSKETTLLLIESLLDGNLKIGSTDGVTADRFLSIDSGTGFLQVQLPPPTTPQGTTPVNITVDTDMTGTVDTPFTITTGKQLTIQQLRAGAEVSTNGSKIELFEDPTGTGTPLTLIDILFVSGSSDSNALLVDLVGNGTKRVILRRTLIGGGSPTEIFAAWRGFEA